MKWGNSGSLHSRPYCVIYDHPIRMLHVKQPHDSFLTVLVITCVNSRADYSCSVSLQKLAPKTYYCTWRNHQGLEENNNVSNL